ncbi:hypothetical protein LRS74_07825 [Streptomyces sp. LX-29]|uniref:hypothetical protein n=1 Tax=Streptomyces sp. LX-29 TaxID=2900152 RepID=UPI00240E2903|nr:hypothetical protein [Streptomyces sp. LX-29]WFB06967.1 hypothetical protein LRS74_07825 [Streptomyces sp. LX-29]
MNDQKPAEPWTSARPWERPERLERPGRPSPAGPGASGERAPVLGPLVREYVPVGRYRRPSGQVAAVLMYENGGYSVVWPDRREDVNKPLIKGPFTVIEVHTGWHLTQFRTELPAAGDAEFFRAEVEVRWRVVDARAAAVAGVWNLAEHLSPVLLRALRGITRRYRISEAERADAAVESELLERGALVLGDDLGLETQVFVRIDLSSRGISAQRERTDVEHVREVERAQHELEREREAREQELNRMRAAELQEVLRGGDDDRIAWFMARDKARAWDIHQAILRERREERELSIETVFRFVDGGLIERQDLNDQTLAAIDFLRSTTRGTMGRAAETVFGLPRHPAASGEDRARARRQLEWSHAERSPEPDAPRDSAPGRDGARDFGHDAEPPYDAGRGPSADRPDRTDRRDPSDRADGSQGADRSSREWEREGEYGHGPGRDGEYGGHRADWDHGHRADGGHGEHADDRYLRTERGGWDRPGGRGGGDRVYEPTRVQRAAERDDHRRRPPRSARDDAPEDRVSDRWDDGRDDRRDRGRGDEGRWDGDRWDEPLPPERDRSPRRWSDKLDWGDE